MLDRYSPEEAAHRAGIRAEAEKAWDNVRQHPDRLIFSTARIPAERNAISSVWVVYPDPLYEERGQQKGVALHYFPQTDALEIGDPAKNNGLVDTTNILSVYYNTVPADETNVLYLNMLRLAVTEGKKRGLSDEARIIRDGLARKGDTGFPEFSKKHWPALREASLSAPSIRTMTEPDILALSESCDPARYVAVAKIQYGTVRAVTIGNPRELYVARPFLLFPPENPDEQICETYHLRKLPNLSVQFPWESRSLVLITTKSSVRNIFEQSVHNVDIAIPEQDEDLRVFHITPEKVAEYRSFLPPDHPMPVIEQ